jgi:hypothetical protein
MMIEPKQSDIGREVIYRVHSNAEAEEGVMRRRFCSDRYRMML